MTKFIKETLPLHHTASGCRYDLDVWRYSPPRATRTVYLQGGIHGIEITGIPVLYEFMEVIEQHQLPDRFICVPQANPMGLDSQMMAVQTGYNNLHTNPQNCLNWNRITNLGEHAGIEGYWIQQLLRLAEEAEVVLDLHTAGAEALPHVYSHASQIATVTGLGIPHILSWTGISTSFSDTCFQRGKTATTFELSASRKVEMSWVSRSVDYLKRYFGLLPPIEGSRIWIVEKQYKSLYSPFHGVLCWLRETGDEICQGEPLAFVYSRDGKQTLISPYNGVLLIKYPIHAPYERQEVAKILVAE
ncbi:MAG: succinylglutamate desuccinylase/aspartoacylase family protein [SAR324 cluster bacterium]|nr:succinylglutamate desuccinylase/aspartoacylase family protein [SAR324 cluster bacterium]